MIPSEEISLYQKFHVTPYNIFGVKLFGVESASGKTVTHCNSREESQDYCDELNNHSIA